jgi:hypothetical protein
MFKAKEGNIQIGLEDALTKLFKEQRGTKYFFGEVFAVSPNLIPKFKARLFS